MRTRILSCLVFMLLTGVASLHSGEAGRKPIKALYIPLADHYAAVVAYEKYGSAMQHADYQLEMLPGPELIRARFRQTDVDMAFNVCPMVLDMFAEKPDFRIHKAGADIEQARRAGGAEMAAIVAMIRKHIPAHTREAITESLRVDVNAINYWNLNVDRNAEGSLQQIMELAVEGGMLKQEVTIADLADESFATDITRHAVAGADAEPTAALSEIAPVPAASAAVITPAGSLDAEAEEAPRVDLSLLLKVGSCAGVLLLVFLFWGGRRGLAIVFRRGLARNLLLWFALLSLVPLLTVSFLSYTSARESLQEHAKRSLRAIAEVQVRYANALYSRRLTDVQQQADDLHNVELLVSLREALNASGKTPHDFTKGFAWKMLVRNSPSHLTLLRKNYGYHDVFLIDTDGTILFTVAKEDDLGSNIFSGEYAHTSFAAACRQALATGQAVFSDYEYYAPSDHVASGFLVSALIDKAGNTAGLIALQISMEQIGRIMQQKLGLGETVETYLIGVDGMLRSRLSRAKEGALLKTPVDSVQVRAWLKAHGGADTPLHCAKEAPSRYVGPHGLPVLGTHKTIAVGGVRLGLIAEIEEREAFAPATQLQYLVGGLLAGTVLLVLVVASLVALRIVRPLRELTAVSRRVEAGDLAPVGDLAAKNEPGELVMAFDRMLASLRKTMVENEAQNWLRAGQNELSSSLRGDLDPATLGTRVIRFLAEYLGAQVGALYVTDAGGRSQMIGSYAYMRRKKLSNSFASGEGLVGQAALEQKPIVLSTCPEDYIVIASGTGKTAPGTILVYPLVREDVTCGVIELAARKPFTDEQIAFLDEATEAIAVVLTSVIARVGQGRSDA